MKRLALLLMSTLLLSLPSCGATSSDDSARVLFGFTGKDLLDLLGAVTGTTAAEDTGRSIGVTVASVAGGYCVPESTVNGTLSLTVVLNKKPTADVTIPMSTSHPTEATLDKSSLVFTSSNWNVTQTVSVRGVSEATLDGNKITTLVFGAAVSDDTAYNGLVPPSVTGLVLIDDDTNSIVVCPPANGLVTTEVGTTDRFSVVLSAQPTADVNVPGISSSDLTEGTVAPASLTFTTANWNVPQIVTVTGANEFILDGNISYQINLLNSTSADANFNNKTYFSCCLAGSAIPNASSVGAVNQDDEASSVVVTPLVLNLNENGPAGTFSVYLTVEPPGNVTTAVTSLTPARATVDKPLLTFTNVNYNTPQVVTVTPVDNNTKDGTIPAVTIDLGVTTNYQNKDPDNVTVNITDNDTPGITVSTLSRNTTEAGQNATYTVVLTSEPSANVTVSFDETNDPINASNVEGTIDKSSVTFTPANWNTPQTVTVTPVNDSVMDGNKQYQIKVNNATSTDTNYSGLAPTPNFVTVNNNDDDVAGFVIVANGVTTNTSNSSVNINGLATDDMNNLDNNTYSRFTIRLRSQPTANVTLTLASSSTTNDGTLSTTSLAYTTANWNVAQAVSVAGASNGTNEGNHTYYISITPTTTDDKYSSTTFVGHPTVTLNSCDNDVANVVIGCRRSGGFTTSEGGGTATLHFITQSNPGANVCIPVTSSNTAEGTVTSPATITTSTWNTMVSGDANKVVATGVDDAVFDGNTQYTLQIANDTCGVYPGFNPPDELIRNTDDEQALEFSAASGDTSENGTTAFFGIRLKTAPANDVQFTIACSAGSNECNGVNVSSLTFTPANWNVYQNVTVTGKNDNRVDGPQSSCVAFGVIASADPAIDGVQPPNTCPITNLDNDRLIWTTTPVTRGNYNSGLTVADSNCNDPADANKPNDIGSATYKALMSDGSTRIATTTGTNTTGQVGWVLAANTEYYLKTGSAPYTNRIFTTNASGFFTFGTLTNAFGGGGDQYWTGLNSNWTPAANNCGQWTNDTAGFNGEYGAGGSTSSSAISSGNQSCDNMKKLICVQQ